jgi:hypothetical protein
MRGEGPDENATSNRYPAFAAASGSGFHIAAPSWVT